MAIFRGILAWQLMVQGMPQWNDDGTAKMVPATADGEQVVVGLKLPVMLIVRPAYYAPPASFGCVMLIVHPAYCAPSAFLIWLVSRGRVRLSSVAKHAHHQFC